MRNLFLFFLVIPFFANAQTDSLFEAFDRPFDKKSKPVKFLKSSFEVLIVKDDTLFTSLSDDELRNKIKQAGDNYRMDIIVDPDSINRIISKKIKSVIIFTKKK